MDRAVGHGWGPVAMVKGSSGEWASVRGTQIETNSNVVILKRIAVKVCEPICMFSYCLRVSSLNMQEWEYQHPLKARTGQSFDRQELSCSQMLSERSGNTETTSDLG